MASTWPANVQARKVRANNSAATQNRVNLKFTGECQKKETHPKGFQ